MKLKTVIRYFLGIMFLMTGGMKIFLPHFGDAFLLQLLEAGIPWPNFNFWMIPIVEIIIGSMLLFKFMTRIALIIIIPIMIVALYVHIVVVNPAAFPAQPQFPIIPLVVLFMVFYLLMKRDVRITQELLKTN